MYKRKVFLKIRIRTFEKGEGSMELTLEKLLKMIKKQLVLVIAIILLCSLAAFLYSAFLMKPVYVCEMKFRVNVSDAKMLDLTSTARLVTLVTDVIERIQSDAFYSMASVNTGEQFSPKDVEKRVEFSLVEDSTVFWMKVSADSPEQALLLGQAVETAAPAHIKSNGEIYAIESLVFAKLPKAPAGPGVLRFTLVGFLLGAVLAVGIVIVVDFFDRRVKSSADLAERYELPILGVVPYFDVPGKKVKK